MLVGVVLIVTGLTYFPCPHARAAGRRTVIMTVSLQKRPKPEPPAAPAGATHLSSGLFEPRMLVTSLPGAARASSIRG